MEHRMTERPHNPCNLSASPNRHAAGIPGNFARLSHSSQTSLPSETDRKISQLEVQVEEQRLLRLHDAQQVEAKAAKIKQWVTNKLRELEQQNQVLRDQNQKCNLQLELLRSHIASQSNRNSLRQPGRKSYSLGGHGRRRSESLEPPENRAATLGHRRNLSMEPQELARDLAAAVDGLNILPLDRRTAPIDDVPMNVDTAHDYAEIYTPSCEKAPVWLKGGLTSGHSSTATVDSVTDAVVARAPTPPLHRFPSWEAKIYQVASDGLAPTDDNDDPDADSTQMHTSRSQQTASGGYCDISVPVYATVKGVSSNHCGWLSGAGFTHSFGWFVTFLVVCSVHHKSVRCHSPATQVTIPATAKSIR